MPKLIATHEVDDVAHWLSSPKRVEVFGSVASNFRTFVDPDNPGPRWSEHGRLRHGRIPGRHGERAGAAAMQYDGVRQDTLVVLVES